MILQEHANVNHTLLVKPVMFLLVRSIISQFLHIFATYLEDFSDVRESKQAKQKDGLTYFLMLNVECFRTTDLSI